MLFFLKYAKSEDLSLTHKEFKKQSNTLHPSVAQRQYGPGKELVDLSRSHSLMDSTDVSSVLSAMRPASGTHSGLDIFREIFYQWALCMRKQFNLLVLPHHTQVLQPRSTWKERVYKFLPILEWLPEYSWKEFGLKDLSGGITLGCILVAQSLAHADLCKVDLIHGPYSCILPPILYSIFGTCIHSSIGTGGLISLLTGEQLANYGDLEQRTHAGAIFTLLVGVVITLMGVFRLAFLVRFLSKPALSGFITASAILIMASQFKPMLGLPKSDTGGIFAIAWFHPDELADLRPPTIAASICAIIYLSVIKKAKSIHWTLRVLGDFKELSALTFFALAASRYASELGVAVVGDVPAGLPNLTWPMKTSEDVALAKEMLPGAVMVALVTFLSSFAGAKKFAMQAGYQVIAINELLALGFANLGGAICGAVPTQIGLSRMGIAYSTGVMSQLGANIYVAVVVALVLKLFSAYLFFVPRCVLNVIILLGAQHLTEFQHMRWLWSLRQTRTRQRTYLVDFSVSCLQFDAIMTWFGEPTWPVGKFMQIHNVLMF
eukprot:symbB.v1.2.014765.t1/scaffold1084.1/size139254/4